MDIDTKFDLILKELKKICTQIDERFEQLEQRIDNLEQRIDNLEQRIENLEQRFENLEQRFEKLENKFDNLSKEVGSSNRTLLKLDVETHEKFETLFEANKTHNDKDLIFENQLYRLHDSQADTISRISVLENKVAINV